MLSFWEAVLSDVQIFKVCKRFTVESGHMLSKHPESCRNPHGHTRTVEVVVSSESLDDNGMVLDFKAMSLALNPHIAKFDHSMAINSEDPLRESIEAIYPGSTVVFEAEDPTTEVIARSIYDFVSLVLRDGWSDKSCTYVIHAGRVKLERVRVWETGTCWAEVSGI